MKKAKYIFIALYIIAAAAVLYFAYGVVKERYFSPGKNSAGTKNGQTQNQADNQAADQSGDNQTNVSSDINNTAPTNGQPNVQNSDCDNNCANFTDNADNLKYCQEVCGIIPVVPKNSEADCANLTGPDQNYCWRDLAVSKKDFSICDKISDAKLQTACRDRVTEEVLN